MLRLRCKSFPDDWEDKDREAAIKVCARFHLVGILMLEGMIPEDLFAKAWYYSVPNCREILESFIRQYRQERDYRYWSAFDRLRDRVIELTKDFKGFA